MVLLSREDVFCSRENLSLREEELDINRIDYYQVCSSNEAKRRKGRLECCRLRCFVQDFLGSRCCLDEERGRRQ